MDAPPSPSPSPDPTPSSSFSPSPSGAVIRDGAVSGLLPESEAFAVHYPGYPSSLSRALHTLGGLSHLASVRSSEAGLLELRFRPEDPYSHPLFAELRPATGLLLRISKNQGRDPSAQIVARVNHAYHFKGMADYQHVVPVHAAKARSNKRPWNPHDSSSDLDSGTSTVMDAPDVMMLVPALFSNKNKPQNIV